jgi:hypothetical protein
VEADIQSRTCAFTFAVACTNGGNAQQADFAKLGHSIVADLDRRRRLSQTWFVDAAVPALAIVYGFGLVKSFLIYSYAVNLS